MVRSMLLVSILAMAGCYKTNLANFSNEGSPGNTVVVWSHSLLYGLIPLSEVDVNSKCGDNGAWAVSTRQNLWNLLLTGITSGIYSPTVAKITCKQ
ncbi:MAG: Bor family protein [Myxococcales bacterium]|nr:Bor family protein [Myxococcales bacterium]